MAHGQVQRIPRQTAPTSAAVVGIVRTPQGQGLGGVTVLLQNLVNGRSIPGTTAGDGSFRFLQVSPGRYQIKAAREGFQPFAQGRNVDWQNMQPIEKIRAKASRFDC
jgi:hypothetical protein